VVTFEVKVEVTSDRKNLLKPEMTANVEIVAAEEKDTLMVPVEALTRKGGKYFANVVGPDGAATERAVEVGISDGVKTQVVSGLNKDETVTLRKSGSESRWNSGQGQRPGGGAPSPGRMMGGGH
jgi:multidrug efflux pump subunit AcrA (membrane-fusion protein)